METKLHQQIYPQPPAEFHGAVLSALYRLDAKSQIRCTKRRRAGKIALVCAVITALGSFSAIAATTKLFGLLSEPIGQFGLHLSVENSENPTTPQYVKMRFGYMTEGFEEEIHYEEDIYDAEKTYDPKDVRKFNRADGAFYTFGVVSADEFDFTETYIIDKEEQIVNGKKLILTTRQIQEGGEVDYGATLYFDDWGYVVGAGAYDGAEKAELKKIMEHLSLEEDKEYTPETVPADRYLNEKRVGYGLDFTAAYTLRHAGEQFGWSEYANGDGEADDFTVAVTDIREQQNADGIPQEWFDETSDYSLRYSEFFDENGDLITPYTRTDLTAGDGIHTQDKVKTTIDDRHFFVVTVEVTSNIEPDEEWNGWNGWFDIMRAASPLVLIAEKDGSLSQNIYQDEYGVWQDKLFGECAVVFATPGDEYYFARIEKGQKRTFLYGIVTDGDILDNTYIGFGKRSSQIDDERELLVAHEDVDCVKLKG